MADVQPRLPAEWEPQAAVLLVWPHSQTDWASTLDAVEPVFVQIARAILNCQTLIVVAHDEAVAARVRDRLRGAPPERLRVTVAACNDTWIRDYGPLTVWRGASLEMVDFRFNGWGGKFDAALDDRVTGELHGSGIFGATSLRSLDLVLEGGAIETDGSGGLLARADCLLDPRRNPALSRQQLEAELARHLGLTRIHWLEHGMLLGDDTDGHIDTLARFTPAGEILYQACDDPLNPHFPALTAMAEELTRLRRNNGRAYPLRPLPLPRRIQDQDGQWLPAGYANFLVLNDAVLMPAYDDPSDALAARQLAAAFPQRRVLAIDSRPLISQGGALHCLTMQIPKDVPIV